MRFFSLVRIAVLALAIIGFTTAANATPITFQMVGTAYGTIGATTFSDALVTLTGTGDTSNIVSGIYGFAYAEPITTTVTIQGVGTATITDPTEIFSTAMPIQFNPSTRLLPYVIIGRTDDPPALDSFIDLTDQGTFSASLQPVPEPPVCSSSAAASPRSIVDRAAAGEPDAARLPTSSLLRRPN
jgi:hypothetical protein